MVEMLNERLVSAQTKFWRLLSSMKTFLIFDAFAFVKPNERLPPSWQAQKTPKDTKEKHKRLIWTFVVLILISCFSCSTSEVHEFDEKEIDLSSYQIEKGFDLEVLASEPLLIAPVAMDFDEQGRMWVLELPGYMADIDGKGEHDPTGRIIILKDQNGNGRMDAYSVFLDKLVAPRAMLLAYDGLLYAEPPNLWFVPIENDQPGEKVLVDSAYVLVGNIEHQANSLTMNIDNWIYSARSNARYQKKNGKWIKEQTAYRGQWGLTKDYFGRLFYNDNSNQFQGDLVLPMAALNNPYLKPKYSIRQQIATDQRLYPLYAAIINRGYAEGNLDESGKPVRITSSCGPLIYQGDLFPSNYNGNSFVCLPEGNIVKRNIMSYQDTSITAEQAWEGKEFIASTDVAFRPVNLYNGPDGAMYIIDLHKGVIQHRAYMSPYLREKIIAQQLDTIVGCGRILRVLPEGDQKTEVILPNRKDVSSLVVQLNHPNVWTRDKAQQILVQGEMKEAIPLLEKMLDQSTYSVGQLHALWTLEGMDALTLEQLEKALETKSADLNGLAFYLLERFVDSNLDKKTDWEQLALNREVSLAQLNVIANVGRTFSEQAALKFYSAYAAAYPNSKLFPELTLNSLSGKEEAFLNHLKSQKENASPRWITAIESTIANRKADKKNQELLPATHQPYGDKRQKGLELYRLYCSACHGEDGNGIDHLAPPLEGSDYVSGDVDRLALIMLHGLQGPIHINGKEYTFNAAMPGIAANSEISDTDILSIIIFLRNAFSTKGMNLTEDRIRELRKEVPPEGQMYTEEMLGVLID